MPTIHLTCAMPYQPGTTTRSVPVLARQLARSSGRPAARPRPSPGPRQASLVILPTRVRCRDRSAVNTNSTAPVSTPWPFSQHVPRRLPPPPLRGSPRTASPPGLACTWRGSSRAALCRPPERHPYLPPTAWRVRVQASAPSAIRPALRRARLRARVHHGNSVKWSARMRPGGVQSVAQRLQRDACCARPAPAPQRFDPSSGPATAGCADLVPTIVGSTHCPVCAGLIRPRQKKNRVARMCGSWRGYAAGRCRRRDGHNGLL